MTRMCLEDVEQRPNFNGTDSFTFRVSDGAFSSNVATVTLQVASVNDPPVAVADVATTSSNNAVTIADLGRRQ